MQLAEKQRINYFMWVVLLPTCPISRYLSHFFYWLRLGLFVVLVDLGIGMGGIDMGEAFCFLFFFVCGGLSLLLYAFMVSFTNCSECCSFERSCRPLSNLLTSRPLTSWML
jgi:hypothetical protein